jgi:hypothetical protein
MHRAQRKNKRGLEIKLEAERGCAAGFDDSEETAEKPFGISTGWGAVIAPLANPPALMSLIQSVLLASPNDIERSAPPLANNVRVIGNLDGMVVNFYYLSWGSGTCDACHGRTARRCRCSRSRGCGERARCRPCGSSSVACPSCASARCSRSTSELSRRSLAKPDLRHSASMTASAGTFRGLPPKAAENHLIPPPHFSAGARPLVLGAARDCVDDAQAFSRAPSRASSRTTGSTSPKARSRSTPPLAGTRPPSPAEERGFYPTRRSAHDGRAESLRSARGKRSDIRSQATAKRVARHTVARPAVTS